jgi:integrase
MDSVTAGDAEGYSRWLTRTRGPNTVRRQVGWAKQYFGAAVKHELLTRNPFVGLAANTRPDRTRDHFVTRDEAAKIMDACPDAEWRLIVALCRFAGLRCPTEVLALRWGDVLWDKERMNVPNVKTGKTTGETFRTLPLFPEVRVQLEAVFDQAPEGTEHVISRYRDANANLRTQLHRIARRAGVAMWDKPFVNMRASCATELAQKYPAYVVTAWLGHLQAVAEAHYWQVTEEHFKKAAQNPAQQTPAKSGREQKGE